MDLTLLVFLISAGAVLVLVLLFPVKKGRSSTRPAASGRKAKAPRKLDATPCSPEDFGYKCVWLAIRNAPPARVAELIQLGETAPANWKAGVKFAYDGGVFITPPVDGWTFALSTNLPPADSENSLEEARSLLKTLSAEFGEAQFFATHRVVELHAWARAEKGRVTREFSYLGEANVVLTNNGIPTEVEKGWNLMKATRQGEHHHEREDQTIPDEDTVLKVADAWSLDPNRLYERNEPVENGLAGFLWSGGQVR